jgi:hypothetical protein
MGAGPLAVRVAAEAAVGLLTRQQRADLRPVDHHGNIIRCSVGEHVVPRRALNNICPARDSPHPDRLRSRRSTHKPSATPSSALPDRARMSRSLIERRYSVPS